MNKLGNAPESHKMKNKNNKYRYKNKECTRKRTQANNNLKWNSENLITGTEK